MTLLQNDNHISFVPIILRMTASCALISIWLIQFFLQPLRQDAINMVRCYKIRILDETFAANNTISVHEYY